MDRERRIVYDPVTGFAVDAETGEVVDDCPIDYGYDARIFSHEDYVKRARAGGVVTSSVHDNGIHSYVDKKNSDPDSKKISKLNERVRVSKKERKIVNALHLLHRYASILELPDNVIEDASKMVRKAVEYKVIRKEYIDEYVVVALVETAKIFGIPIALSEAITKLNLSTEGVKRALRSYKELGVLKPVVIDPKSFVPKIVDRLGLGNDVMNIANKIIDAMKIIGITTGRSPNGVAGAAVYIASIVTENTRTQDQVAEVCGLKNVAIRLTYHAITKYIDIEVKL